MQSTYAKALLVGVILVSATLADAPSSHAAPANAPTAVASNSNRVSASLKKTADADEQGASPAPVLLASAPVTATFALNGSLGSASRPAVRARARPHANAWVLVLLGVFLIGAMSARRSRAFTT